MMATTNRRRELEAPDGSSKWLYSLTAVDDFLFRYEQTQRLRQIVRKPNDA